MSYLYLHIVLEMYTDTNLIKLSDKNGGIDIIKNKEKYKPKAKNLIPIQYNQ
jgi:hypothetical protein